MALRVKEHIAVGWIGNSPHGFELIVNHDWVVGDHFLVCPAEVLPHPPGSASSHRFPPGNAFRDRAHHSPDPDCDGLDCDHTVNLFLYFFGEMLLTLRDRCVEYSNPEAMVACQEELVRTYDLVVQLREEGAIRSLRLRYDLGDACETGAICWEHPTRGWICFE